MTIDSTNEKSGPRTESAQKQHPDSTPQVDDDGLVFAQILEQYRRGIICQDVAVERLKAIGGAK